MYFILLFVSTYFPHLLVPLKLLHLLLLRYRILYFLLRTFFPHLQYQTLPMLVLEKNDKRRRRRIYTICNFQCLVVCFGYRLDLFGKAEDIFVTISLLRTIWIRSIFSHLSLSFHSRKSFGLFKTVKVYDLQLFLLILFSSIWFFWRVKWWISTCHQRPVTNLFEFLLDF